ncbi:alpha/beta hydrolase [Akkermansiaceae bacterium]|nr:alpha/beta hydrolase [Akkermansiaceae bacterium]
MSRGDAILHSSAMQTQPSLVKILLLAFTIISGPLTAQVERERDIIYMKTEGVVLTMDVFKPAKPNGIGILKIVSGGWKSGHFKVKDHFSKPYTDHGYTVFAVVHGSQPRYKVRDIMAMMQRAVRFVRTNADRWAINPKKIGVTGSSAGGHLSLILATKGDDGNPDAKKDPVERVSSRVQAAAVFYPPTDYMNWAEPGDMAVGVGKQAKWQPAFGPESETAEGREALGRAMSSIYHISKQTPPIFIIHGDADPIVPLHQATSFKKVADAKGATTEIMVKEGGAHGWPNRIDDEIHFVKWFDQHLLGKTN